MWAKTCASNADCEVFYHQVDCCGTMRAFGINGDDGFNLSVHEYESICLDTWPGCGCASQGVITDDGQTSFSGEVELTCDRDVGECRTFSMMP